MEYIPSLMNLLNQSALESARTDRVVKVLVMTTVLLLVLIGAGALFSNHEATAEKIFVAILAFLGGMGAARAKG